MRFQRYADLVAHGQRVDAEGVRRRKDGSRLHVFNRPCARLGAWGKIAVYGIYHDITERKRAEDALRRNERYLAAGQKLSHTGSWALNVSSGELFWSQETFRIFGFDPAKTTASLAETFLQRIHPDDRPRIEQGLKQAPMATGNYEVDYRIVLPDGSIKHIHDVIYPVTNEAGQVVERYGVVRDITDSKRAEEQLKRSEAYLAESQRLSHVGSWAVHISPRELVFWSREHYRMWGFDPANGIPPLQAVLERIHPEDRPKVDEAFESAIRAQRDYVFDFRIVLPDGTTKYCHSIGHPVVNQGGDLVEFIGTVMDVTESRRAEEELQHSFDQLRALTAQLQNVREEERTRVAREIHDELGQALTAIKLDVTALVRRLPAEQEPAVQRGQSILKLLDETIQSVQRISTDLRPGILDDLGLGAALEWAAEEFETRTGTRCRISMPDEDIHVDPDRATALFRIFQEILTNVARHAKATQVNVRLAKENGNLALEVHDNGLGISEQQLSAGKSLGILGMRERARLLGGELIIQGVHGAGTTVRARIPRAEPQRK